MSSGNGQPDSYFVAAVRRILRDLPAWFTDNLPTDGASGTLVAGQKPFRLQRAPVVADKSLIFLTAPGGGYTVDLNDVPPIPVAGHVNIVTETGEVIFAAAPGVGTLAVTYQATRYSDTQVLDALTQGLNLLWPEIWNPVIDTTSIALSPTQYEYSLPLAFRDQRVTLLEVEYAPPSGIVKYYRTGLWRVVPDVVNPLLVLTKLLPVPATVRLTYAPVLGELGQVPSLAMFLPVYYAVARILMDQETMRSRSDDLPALTGEGASPAGTSVQTAAYWMSRFDAELLKMDVGAPLRKLVKDRAVERLGLSGIWNAA